MDESVKSSQVKTSPIESVDTIIDIIRALTMLNIHTDGNDDEVLTIFYLPSFASSSIWLCSASSSLDGDGRPQLPSRTNGQPRFAA